MTAVNNRMARPRLTSIHIFPKVVICGIHRLTSTADVVFLSNSSTQVTCIYSLVGPHLNTSDDEPRIVNTTELSKPRSPAF
jgi:hypothetical protein